MKDQLGRTNGCDERYTHSLAINYTCSGRNVYQQGENIQQRDIFEVWQPTAYTFERSVPCILTHYVNCARLRSPCDSQIAKTTLLMGTTLLPNL